MARAPSITLQDVAQAVNNLLSKGEKPTIAKVREMLGNKGSPNTISKLLKELKSGSEPASSASETIAEKPQVQKPAAKPSEFQADTAGMHSDKPVEITIEFEPAEPAHGKEKPKSQNDAQPKQVDKQQQAKQHKQKHQHGRQHNQQDGSGQQSRHQNQHKQKHQHNKKQQRFDRRPEPQLAPELLEEVYQSEDLERLSQEQLVARVRRLETILNKEQFRRESAEVMAREAKEYAEVVKQQVSDRINDIKESMGITVASLESQLKEAKQAAEQDLKYYREHLSKATQKIEQLQTS